MLFVALVFLVILTLLGLTAAGTSILQERMTGGMHNAEMAMMGSHSALHHGDLDLWAAAPRMRMLPCFLRPCAQSDGPPCVYTRTAGIVDKRVNQFRSSRAWLTETAMAQRLPAVSTPDWVATRPRPNLSTNPRYLIEDMGSAADANHQGNPRWKLIPKPSLRGVWTIHFYHITSSSQGGNRPPQSAVTESVFGAYDVKTNSIRTRHQHHK